MTKTAVDTFEPSSLDHSIEWLRFVGEVALKTGQFVRDGHRKGQAIMNALFRVRPDLYNYATGTIWDPFYKDENLTPFWHKIYDQFVLTLDD